MLGSTDDPSASRIGVLDVGAGDARIPIAICQRRGNVFATALDSAPAVLQRARNQIEMAGLTGRIHLQAGQADSLPYADESFDAVISNGLIHHLPEPARALREMLRVLRSEGLLFVRDSLRQPDFHRVTAILAGGVSADSGRGSAGLRIARPATLDLPGARDLAQGVGLPGDWVNRSGPHCWTIAGRLPPRNSASQSNSGFPALRGMIGGWKTTNQSFREPSGLPQLPAPRFSSRGS